MSGQSMGMALVTGASAGIGAEYADRLARKGYQPILVARSEAKLRELAARLLDETGVACEILPADLGVADDLLAVAQRIATDDRISVLVNNAGIAGPGKFTGADPDQLQALIDLNVAAVTRLSGAAAQQMSRNGRGTIVNISSVTALMPESFDPVYVASKAFVLALSQALAGELGPLGVRVQAVLPGVTRTAIWEKSGHSLDRLPPEMVMEVDTMVDAAMKGLELGETVTIPSLPDEAEWLSFEAMRHALKPRLSLNSPAPRYRIAVSGAA